MRMCSPTWTQVAGMVAVAVGLAVTDGASLSRISVAWAERKAGFSPGQTTRYEETGTDADPPE